MDEKEIIIKGKPNLDKLDNEIIDKHISITAAELFKNRTFTTSASVITRKNSPQSDTKFFIYLLKYTARAVPNTAIRGRNKVNNILK